MALKKCRECGREVSTEAKACPHCGKTNPTNRMSLGSIGCLAILGVLLFSFIVGGSGSSSSSNSAPDVKSPKEQVMDSLDLAFTWSKEGFGSVMEATFTITNKSSRQIKDVEIECTHSAASGTVIDRNTRTIYEVVPAKGKKRIPNFNMGFIHSQVERSNCGIIDFVLG